MRLRSVKAEQGVHNVKEKVDDKDMSALLDNYKNMGIDVRQTGQFETDVHYYLNTEPSLDFIYELGNCPDIIIPEEMKSIYPKE